MILGQEVHKKSLNYIYKRTRNLENSKDILQDAYIEYFLKKDRIKHENHEGYFYCVVKNKTIEYFRRNQIKAKVFEDVSLEELNSKSYNDGPYNHDIKVLSSTEVPDFLESRLTFTSKESYYLVREGEKKIFKKKKTIKHYHPKVKVYSIRTKDKLTIDQTVDYLSKEFKHEDFESEVGIKVRLDKSINLIRVHAKGFNAISSNNFSFCMRYYNNNTGNEKTKRWIQII